MRHDDSTVTVSVLLFRNGESLKMRTVKFNSDIHIPNCLNLDNYSENWFLSISKSSNDNISSLSKETLVLQLLSTLFINTQVRYSSASGLYHKV